MAHQTAAESNHLCTTVSSLRASVLLKPSSILVFAMFVAVVHLPVTLPSASAFLHLHLHPENTQMAGPSQGVRRSSQTCAWSCSLAAGACSLELTAQARPRCSKSWRASTWCCGSRCGCKLLAELRLFDSSTAAQCGAGLRAASLSCMVVCSAQVLACIHGCCSVAAFTQICAEACFRVFPCVCAACAAGAGAGPASFP